MGIVGILTYYLIDKEKKNREYRTMDLFFVVYSYNTRASVPRLPAPVFSLQALKNGGDGQFQTLPEHSTLP